MTVWVNGRKNGSNMGERIPSIVNDFSPIFGLETDDLDSICLQCSATPLFARYDLAKRGIWVLLPRIAEHSN